MAKSPPATCHFEDGLEVAGLLRDHLAQSVLSWFRQNQARSAYVCGGDAKGKPLFAELRADSRGAVYAHVRLATQDDLLDRSALNE